MAWMRSSTLVKLGCQGSAGLGSGGATGLTREKKKRMGAQKYVVLLDAAHAVAAGERDEAVERLRENAAGAAGLAGLTVGSLNESLTGPAETIAVVQAWIDDSVRAEAEAVLDHLTDSVDAKVSSWLVEEIVFLAPVDRRVSSGEHSRLNLFGTAAKRDDFTTEEFFDYWRTVHAPISSSIPGSSGYVVSRVRETVSKPVERTVDAFIELWYPSRDAQAGANEHPLAAKAWEDVPNYARTDGQFWFTYEHVVVEPPATGPGMFDSDGD